MDKYHIGETVICWQNVKDDAGNYVDPATSITITITDKLNNVKVDKVAMTRLELGKYRYDCQTVGYVDGKYEVIKEITDGTRISIQPDSFVLE